jgi:cell division septal protein FtsQ
MNKIRGFDKRLIWPILLVVVNYLVLFLAWDNMSFSEQDISGNIILNTDNVYHSGEILSGKLKIEVNQ